MGWGNRSLDGTFRGATEDAGAEEWQRSRIDARTIGFVSAQDDKNVEWMGIVPVKDDQWDIIAVRELNNEYLRSVNQNEKIAKIQKKNDDSMSFEEAVKRLAVWEMASMAKETKPAPGHNAADIGRHNYRDMAMRRGYLISTTGELCRIENLYPPASGSFLQSDLDALRAYREGFKEDSVLDDLFEGHEPFHLDTEKDLNENIAAFAEVGLFSRMQFFAQILIEYAKVKIACIDDYYNDPRSAKSGQPIDNGKILQAIGKNPYFDAVLVDKANELRESLFDKIFKAFHVVREDWDEELDFNSIRMKQQLLLNPDARETYDLLSRKINHPPREKDMNALLLLSARGLLYGHQLLQSSAQKDLLERKDVYKQSDILSLLNFMDLLYVKYDFADIASVKDALPSLAQQRDSASRRQDFEMRVRDLKDNLRENGELSAVQQEQIDAFIMAGRSIHLPKRIEGLSARLEAAERFISETVLKAGGTSSQPVQQESAPS